MIRVASQLSGRTRCRSARASSCVSQRWRVRAAPGRAIHGWRVSSPRFHASLNAASRTISSRRTVSIVAARSFALGSEPGSRSMTATTFRLNSFAKYGNAS